MALTLTERDHGMLLVLTTFVRVLLRQQAARTWWPAQRHAHQSAETRVRSLAEAGFLYVYRAVTHPELLLEAPVAEWAPPSPAPNLGAVSYRLRRRWTQRPQLGTFLVATRKAQSLFGKHGGRKPREVELTHDFHVSGVFLRLRELDPAAANQWMFEEEIREQRDYRSEKLPDAILKRAEGPLVIEFGGAYTKKKLEGFHTYCADNALPYQIW